MGLETAIICLIVESVSMVSADWAVGVVYGTYSKSKSSTPNLEYLISTLR